MDDTRYRYLNDDETLQQIADTVQSRIFTAIPVKVVEDSDGHTTHIQPLIKWVNRKPDGSEELKDFPPIKDAPNQFASGGGTTATFPIKKGDQGLALVPYRSIDNWHEKDGTQPQVDARMHDLSDAFYLPGVRSTPRKLKDYNKDASEIRSDDGKHRSSLHPKDGIKHSVDDGKHVVTLHPKSGIGVKTDMKLAVDAKQGTTFKGMAHFEDDVTSNKSFSAPSLNGATGGSYSGPFMGMMHALIGAVVGGGMVLALAGQGAESPVSQARYALARLVR